MCSVTGVSVLCYRCQCVVLQVSVCCVTGVSVLCYRCQCVVLQVSACCVTGVSVLCYRCQCVVLQVFHCHFNSNFFPLFLDNLLGDAVPQVVLSLILGE